MLAAERDVHKLVQTVTDAATRLTRAQFGAFFYNLVNESGESYTLFTLSGVSREAFEKFPMPRNTEHLRADVQRRRRRAARRRHDGPALRQERARTSACPQGHLPVRSYLAVPVVSRTGEVLGGLFFGHAEVGRFTRSGRGAGPGHRQPGGRRDRQRAALPGADARRGAVPLPRRVDPADGLDRDQRRPR